MLSKTRGEGGVLVSRSELLVVCAVAQEAAPTEDAELPLSWSPLERTMIARDDSTNQCSKLPRISLENSQNLREIVEQSFWKRNSSRKTLDAVAAVIYCDAVSAHAQYAIRGEPFDEL